MILLRMVPSDAGLDIELTTLCVAVCKNTGNMGMHLFTVPVYTKDWGRILLRVGLHHAHS